MNSDSQAYEQKRAELIRRIDETEIAMIEMYREHLQKLLTDTESGVVCVDMYLEEIETIRTRRYSSLYDDECYRTSHKITFHIGDDEVIFELSWSNLDHGCGSRPFHSEMKIIFEHADTTIEYECDDNDWFRVPDRYSDHKKEREEFFREISSAFKEHAPSVSKCAHVIINHAADMRW